MEQIRKTCTSKAVLKKANPRQKDLLKDKKKELEEVTAIEKFDDLLQYLPNSEGKEGVKVETGSSGG